MERGIAPGEGIKGRELSKKLARQKERDFAAAGVGDQGRIITQRKTRRRKT